VPTVKTTANWTVHEPGPVDWEQVTFEPSRQALSQPLTALLSAFRAAIDRASAATFQVNGLTPILRLWLTEDHGDQFPYVSRLLNSPALADALPDLVEVVYPRQPGDERDDPVFEWIPPLFLAPWLAHQLSTESAYDTKPSISSAKALADAYVADLIGDRFSDFHVADSNDAWSDWFHDVVISWDHTWVITDLRYDHVTLICVTDED
jgi:hypothetical protein